jgi:hypothetical protein
MRRASLYCHFDIAELLAPGMIVTAEMGMLGKRYVFWGKLENRGDGGSYGTGILSTPSGGRPDDESLAQAYVEAIAETAKQKPIKLN